MASPSSPTGRQQGEFAPVTVAGPRFVCGVAEEFGVERLELLRRAGVDPDMLQDRRHRVPYAVAKQMWTHASELCGEENLGIRAAERIKPHVFGVMGFAVVSCSRARDAAQRMIHYATRYYEDLDLELDLSEEVGVLRQGFVTSEPGQHPQLETFVLAGIVLLSREVLGQQWDPISVSLAEEKPASTDDYTRVFRCPVHFGADANVVRFPTNVLDQPLLDANDELAHMLNRYVEELLSDLQRDRGFSNDVRRALVGGVARGQTSLEETARSLGLSPRTLQRRLRSEQTSHRGLLDSVRERLAHRYLLDRRLTVDEVAESLGFSEPSAFHRAFRRWTGSTPAVYRENAERSNSD